MLRMMVLQLFTSSPPVEQSRCEVFQVAPPCLPLVIRSWRFIEDVLDIRFFQRRVQLAIPCAHSLRFLRADAEPEHMHFLRERRRIGEYTVVIGLRIEFPLAEHERPAAPLNPPM